MKVLIFVVASLALASAFPRSSEEPEGCALCREQVQKLHEHALSMEAAQEFFLIENVCKNGDFEVGGCSVGVVTWWAPIANVLYGTPEFVARICHHINHECHPEEIKTFYTPKEWDCDTCKADLELFAGGANCQENMAHALKHLNDEICKDANFNEEQQEACKKFIDAFVPAAVKALTDDMLETAAETCNEVYEVC